MCSFMFYFGKHSVSLGGTLCFCGRNTLFPYVGYGGNTCPSTAYIRVLGHLLVEVVTF